MKAAGNVRLVLVTAPDRKTARTLANLALKAHLVACANLIPGLESHYWWKGKIDRSKEYLILFKTTRDKVGALEKIILSHHPYDVAEVISLSLDASTPRYLAWLVGSIR